MKLTVSWPNVTRRSRAVVDMLRHLSLYNKCSLSLGVQTSAVCSHVIHSPVLYSGIVHRV